MNIRIMVLSLLVATLAGCGKEGASRGSANAGGGSAATPSASGDSSSRESLTGAWWEVEGKSAYEFSSRDAATFFDATKGRSSLLFYKWLDATHLRFEPEMEVGGGVFTCSISGDEVTLARPDGTAVKYFREERRHREKRVADLFAKLEREERDAKERGSLEEFNRTAPARRAEIESMFRVLAGPGEDAQKVAIERVLSEHQPQLWNELKGRILTPQQPGQEGRCRSNLMMIGVCLSMYESRNGGYPRALSDLMKADLGMQEDHFTCNVTCTKDAYEYVFPSRGKETPEDAVLAYDRLPHLDGLRAVLFVSGKVDFLDKDKLEEALKK